jgi:phosphatidylserine/phosphatidylglycerophosphate/cardiolipin synthase-like enzyme
MRRWFPVLLLSCGSLFAQLPWGEPPQPEPRVGEFDTRTEVLVTRDAAETTLWKMELIRNAQQSIELSPNFAGGREYQQALQLAAEAMERNSALQMHLLYEQFLMDDLDIALTEQLAERFPAQFHPVQIAMETKFVESGSLVGQHMKILVVDGKYFVVGGTSLEQTLSTEGLRPEEERPNIPKEYSIAGARDMDIVGVGPLAETLRKIYFTAHARFERLVIEGTLQRDDALLAPHSRYWAVDPKQATTIPALDFHPELVRGAPIKVNVGNPFDAQNAITCEYVRLIEGARKSIDIGNLYFMPVRPIFEALLGAGNRGVNITMTTNGVRPTSPMLTKLFGWGTRLNYYPLLTGVELTGPDYFFANEIPQNQVQIYEYDVERVLYHKKVMVVDGTTVLIGSYNLGKRSDLGDFELALTLESPAAAQKVLQVLALDHAYSQTPSREEITQFYFAPWYVALGKTQQAAGGLY